MGELATTTQQLPPQVGGGDDQTAQLVAMWLHGRSPHTQRAYAAHVARCFAAVQKPVHLITLSDLQAFADTLHGLADNSQGAVLSAVKSLLSFGHRIGVLQVNVGAPLKLPKAKETLAARILSEAEVHRMIALETAPRNRLLLRLLYAAGVRAEEICALAWQDAQARGDAGQLTVYGKGGKTRVVLLSPATWQDLQASKPAPAAPETPLFPSRKGGGHLTTPQIWRIVRAAAVRAGIAKDVSPHWLRHSHASHALDRNAPIHLVQATLGHSDLSTTGRYLHARPADSSARYLGV